MKNTFPNFWLAVCTATTFIGIVRGQLSPCYGTTGVLNIPDPADCTRFFICVNGKDFPNQCTEGLIFDVLTNQCNREEDSVCIVDVPTIPTAGPSETTVAPVTTPDPITTPGTEAPSEVPSPTIPVDTTPEPVPTAPTEPEATTTPGPIPTAPTEPGTTTTIPITTTTVTVPTVPVTTDAPAAPTPGPPPTTEAPAAPTPAPTTTPPPVITTTLAPVTTPAPPAPTPAPTTQPPITTTVAPPPPVTTTVAPPPPITTTVAPPPPVTTTVAPPPPITTTVAPPPPGPIPTCNVWDDFYAPHPDCTRFFRCVFGTLHVLNCPPNQFWNQARLYCDHPWNVVCPVSG